MTKDEKHVLVSLYDWCVQATEREIDRNCETLSRLKNSSAAIYAEFMAAPGTKAPAKAAGRALVKRFHLPALKLKGEQFTAEDQRLVDDFINFARFRRFAAENPSAAVKAREKIGKGALAKDLKSRLEPLLGKAELLVGGVWKYETSARSFQVATYIDIGGRLPLRYSHKIIARSGRTICETSLLHWHGIATETAWDSMGPKDEDSSVQLLVELCERFLAAIEEACGHSAIATGATAPGAR
jgi:hypothetical protein